MWRAAQRLSVLWETGRTGLQIVRYSQELILEPNSCISSHLEEHYHPSWWWLFLVTSRSFIGTAEIFYKKKKIYIYIYMCLIACAPSVSKSHLYFPSLLPLWSSLSELSEVWSPGLQSSYCPQYNLTRNSHIVLFFFFLSWQAFG